MTATDIFRVMLDERGVEYRIERKQTRATFEPFDRFIVLDEHGGLRGTIDVYPDGACNCTWQFNDLTPEQAIVATLGRGTCQIETTENWLPAERYHRCKECGAFFAVLDASHDIPPRYCPNCGERIEVGA